MRNRKISIKYYIKREISFEAITLIVLSIYCIDILKICSEMFSAISVGDDEHKVWRLVSDMSVDYNSSSHTKWKYLLAFPIIIIVGFCVPSYIFYRLYYQKKRGDLHNCKEFLFKFGYFYYPYEERYYYYDFVLLLRRWVLMFFQVYFIDLIKFNYKLNSSF